LFQLFTETQLWTLGNAVLEAWMFIDYRSIFWLADSTSCFVFASLVALSLSVSLHLAAQDVTGKIEGVIHWSERRHCSEWPRDRQEPGYVRNQANHRVYCPEGRRQFAVRGSLHLRNTPLVPSALPIPPRPPEQDTSAISSAALDPPPDWVTGCHSLYSRYRQSDIRSRWSH